MTTSTHCDPQLKPEEKEPCNTQDCIPEIGKVEELCVSTMELHLVEKEVVEIFFLKYRVLFLHKLWLFSVVERRFLFSFSIKNSFFFEVPKKSAFF